MTTQINVTNGVLAASNNALSAALNTVSTSANAVSRTVATVDDGLDMFEAYLRKAKNEQRIRYLVEENEFKHRLFIDTAAKRAELDLTIESKLSDPNFKTRFDAALSELNTLITSSEG